VYLTPKDDDIFNVFMAKESYSRSYDLKYCKKREAGSLYGVQKEH